MTRSAIMSMAVSSGKLSHWWPCGGRYLMRYSRPGPDTRLVRHLESWLGAWPPPSGKLVVVGSERREQPGWDGRIQQVTGVATPEGAVLSVPTAAAPDVQALTNGDLESLDWLGQRLGE